MKHRTSRPKFLKAGSVRWALTRLHAGRVRDVLPHPRRPVVPVALVAVAILAAGGGVVAWQTASADPRPAGTHVGHAAALPPPILPSTDRDDRASRGTPRQPPPTTVVTTPPAPVTTTVPPPPPPPSPPPAPPTRRAPQTTEPEPAPVAGGDYVQAGEPFSGEASFYGDGDGTDGGPTASGETFDANALTAASPDLPFDTLLNVCYQQRCVVVRINDRGPFVGGRVLDLSARAARTIGMYEIGVAYVTATPVRPAG